MPITGRSIAGAGLMGLGEGLQKWSDQTIKRKQIADEWAFELKKQKLQQEAAQEGKQQEALQKLLESTVANPGSVDAQLRMASIMMPNRLSPEAADQVRQIAEQTGTQHLLHQLGTTKNPADFPPDLAQALSQNTGRDFGSRPPTVDAAQWGGAAPDWGGPPALLQAINIERQRRAQLDQEEQDKIAQLGKQKEAEAYGTATGTATATHEGAPRLTQDQIDAINAKSGPNAAAAGATKHAEEMAGVAPDVTQGKAAQTTAVAGAGLTPELQRLRAQQAGAVAGATEAAQAPYHPTMLYGDEGNAIAVVNGPNGPTVVPNMPQGYSTKPQKPLTQGQVETLSTINTAELESVRILQELHKSGLDRDNSPWSPRMTNLIAQTFKVAPPDALQADVGQRSAFVRGTLLRALAGARPSKEYMDLLGAHLPDSIQSGQQLAKVINNILQQAGEKRDQMAQLTNRNRKSISPKTQPGQMDYGQWLDAVRQERAGGARAGSAPPGLSTAPAGSPAPDPGASLMDDILKRPAR